MFHKVDLRRVLFTSLGIGGAMLLGEPALRPMQTVEATAIQYWIISVEPGWKCESCCTTGFCCTVPVILDC